MPPRFTRKAARGLIAQLNDPYTTLYSPKEFAAFTQGTNGRYAGVGMQIEDIKGNITVNPCVPEHAGSRRWNRRG